MKIHKRFLDGGATLLGGVLLVGLLGGLVRPNLNDMAHTTAILTAGGGKVFHGAHYAMNGELFGKYTMFLTATVMPPIRGDIKVELTGPEELEYKVTSRYPPAVPLVNRSHPWYRFEDGMILGAQPGDDIIVVLQIEPPSEPGAYEVTFTDMETGQQYLTMPTLFGDVAASEDCH